MTSVGPLQPLGQPGDGRGLAGAGRAEQHGVLVAGRDPLLHLGDRLRLVAGGHHVGDDLEGRHPALQVSYWSHVLPPPGLTARHPTVFPGLTGTVRSAAGPGRPGVRAAAQLGPQVADLAVELGPATRSCRARCRRWPAGPPGWPGRPPAAATCSPGHAAVAGPAGLPGSAAARPPPRPGRRRRPAGSRRSAGCRGPRSRPRAGGLLQLGASARRPAGGRSRSAWPAGSGSANTISPSLARSRRAVRGQHAGAEHGRDLGQPGGARRDHLAGHRSASISTAPCAARRRATSLLPAPMPPVSPTLASRPTGCVLPGTGVASPAGRSRGSSHVSENGRLDCRSG